MRCLKGAVQQGVRLSALVSAQFLRFCIVGGIGFVVDAGVLHLLVASQWAGPYAARVLSFLFAATATWAINRRYTFQVAHASSGQEWARYSVLMLAGAFVNYSVYAGCVMSSMLVRDHLWMGVAAGSVAGMGVNYTSAKSMFKKKSPDNTLR